MHILSYGCTWEVWRALKKLELLSAAPQATLTHFSCSPNFPYASINQYTHAKHEQILNFFTLDIIAEHTEHIHFRNYFKLSFLFTFPFLPFLHRFFSVTSGGYYSEELSTQEQKVQGEINIHSLSSDTLYVVSCKSYFITQY